EVDELLLQLEAALALPTPAPWQAARQLLKLRALKQALEGRGAVAQGLAAPAAWLPTTLRQSGLSPAQRQRLQAVVAALRSAAPGALGSATYAT
ncbi:MAG TPA: hypothetical protein VET87_08135, partial [Rubrivivax sp.]|nr:hypothetical protein [Rubrivivax sp.]